MNSSEYKAMLAVLETYGIIEVEWMMHTLVLWGQYGCATVDFSDRDEAITKMTDLLKSELANEIDGMGK